MKKRTYIAALLVVILSISVSFAAQDQQIQQKLAALEKIRGKFTFAVLGDNRSGDAVYRKLVSMLMERKPDFVVNTGDLIATPGDKEAWAAFWKMSKPIIVPYFPVAGNHDVRSKVFFSEKTYKEQVDLPGNELYYSFVAGNSLFIVLDTNLDDQEKKITGEQYQWLERVLSNSSHTHTFIFMHHPFFTEPGKGRHSGNSLDKYPKDRDRLEALLVKYKVGMVFAGHEHFYQRKTVDTIKHIITGGGGAPLYAGEKDGGFNHFILVTVDGDKVNAEVVDINGKVRDRF